MKKAKRIFAVLLVAVTLFLSQVACDESGSGTSSKPRQTVISSNTGGDWKRCDSLTCTYKVRVTKDIKTGIKGVRINLATAVPLGGNWK
jgi:hypothetical protein